MSNQTKQSLVTPVGELMWVAIAGQARKFNKSDPDEKANWEVSLRMSPEVFAPCKAEIDAFYDEFVKGQKGKHADLTIYKNFVEKHTDKDTGEVREVVTDDFILKAKTKAFWKDGTPNMVQVVDAQGNPFPREYLEANPIGNGSTGRLVLNLATWEYPKGTFGATAYLQGLQIGKYEVYTTMPNMDAIEGDSSASTAPVDGEGS